MGYQRRVHGDSLRSTMSSTPGMWTGNYDRPGIWRGSASYVRNPYHTSSVPHNATAGYHPDRRYQAARTPSARTCSLDTVILSSRLTQTPKLTNTHCPSIPALAQHQTQARFLMKFTSPPITRSSLQKRRVRRSYASCASQWRLAVTDGAACLQLV